MFQWKGTSRGNIMFPAIPREAVAALWPLSHGRRRSSYDIYMT